MGQEILETAQEAIKRDNEWIPTEPRYSAYDLKKKELKHKKTFCNFPWKEPAINWDESVLPCCAVYQEKYSFGNIFTQDFKTIWNGEEFQSARSVLNGLPSKQQTICHICKANGFKHF